MARIRQFSYSFIANERININMTGNVVRCVTGATIFEIEPDRSEKIQLQEGLGMTFEREFKKLTVVNGATPQTIKLYIGDGGILDSRLYGSLTTTASGHNTITDVGDIDIDNETQTIAANGDRARIVVQADLNNSAILRVGPNASGTRGIEVTAGASYPFYTSSALQVYSPSASQKYRWIEESNT